MIDIKKECAYVIDSLNEKYFCFSGGLYDL